MIAALYVAASALLMVWCDLEILLAVSPIVVMICTAEGFEAGRTYQALLEWESWTRTSNGCGERKEVDHGEEET